MDERVKGAKCALARRRFYDYCQVLSPDFYKEDRVYLRALCNEYQEFIEGSCSVMIVAIPPRHGKTRTLTNLAGWYLGKNPDKKVMVGAYNETLSESFSKDVKTPIETVPFDKDIIVYRDIFPNIGMKKGSSAINTWTLRGQHSTFLATSPGGTATGFGANLLILDDLIRNALEANNAAALEALWLWFSNTMIQRLEEGAKLIINATRWHTNDPAGMAIKFFTSIGKEFKLIELKAHLGDGVMLCPEILSYESYLEKCLLMGADIASANYQQIPIDIKGKLYKGFKTYSELPPSRGVYSYCDTADEGKDYLCNIIYADVNHEAYVLDVLYTKSPMEITEPEVAKRLTQFKVIRAKIESNNGGRGFARTIERLLLSNRNYFTTVKWFHQSKNKDSRILTHATWVMDHVYFPENWASKWPEFYESMVTYQSEGKNAHDDAQDCLTGVSEQFNEQREGLGIIKLRGV